MSFSSVGTGRVGGGKEGKLSGYGGSEVMFMFFFGVVGRIVFFNVLVRKK